MRQTLAAAGWLVLAALTVRGQGTTAAPEFEVASVKPADAKDRGPLANLPGHVAEAMGFQGGPGTRDPGRIDYQGVSLKMLLARAYDVKPEEISGPGWLGSELFTIEAKVAPGTTAGQLRLMLRKLLADRFQVSLHREVKETPVYRLKVAKNGPRLKPPEADPQYKDEDERRESTMKSAQANLAKMLAAQRANALNGVKTPNFRRINLPHATMARLAEMLSGSLDRLVKDMTQLEGEYRIELEWNPQNPADEEPLGTSIFQAIEEQLGLKLEAGNEAIELLVIDKASKVPTGN